MKIEVKKEKKEVGTSPLITRKSSLKEIGIQNTFPAKELKFEITPIKEALNKEDLDEVALKI